MTFQEVNLLHFLSNSSFFQKLQQSVFAWPINTCTYTYIRSVCNFPSINSRLQREADLRSGDPRFQKDCGGCQAGNVNDIFPESRSQVGPHCVRETRRLTLPILISIDMHDCIQATHLKPRATKRVSTDRFICEERTGNRLNQRERRRRDDNYSSGTFTLLS